MEAGVMEDKIISLTAQIVSAHIAANDVATDQLPRLIRDVHKVLATVGQAPIEPVPPSGMMLAASILPDIGPASSCDRSGYDV
jgi:predicted transcriptional regulator